MSLADHEALSPSRKCNAMQASRFFNKCEHLRERASDEHRILPFSAYSDDRKRDGGRNATAADCGVARGAMEASRSGWHLGNGSDDSAWH
jgi:hypothetical protein